MVPSSAKRKSEDSGNESLSFLYKHSVLVKLLYEKDSGRTNCLSASQQCESVLLYVLITQIVYHIECYKTYSLRVISVEKQLIQDNDGGHSGDEHHEKKCKSLVRCRMLRYFFLQ
jgi:hypothetical protein